MGRSTWNSQSQEGASKKRSEKSGKKGSKKKQTSQVDAAIGATEAQENLNWSVVGEVDEDGEKPTLSFCNRIRLLRQLMMSNARSFVGENDDVEEALYGLKLPIGRLLSGHPLLKEKLENEDEDEKEESAGISGPRELLLSLAALPQELFSCVLELLGRKGRIRSGCIRNVQAAVVKFRLVPEVVLSVLEEETRRGSDPTEVFKRLFPLKRPSSNRRSTTREGARKRAVVDKDIGDFHLGLFVEAKGTDRAWSPLNVRHALRRNKHDFDNTCVLITLKEVRALYTQHTELFGGLAEKLRRAMLFVVGGGESRDAMSLVRKCCRKGVIRTVAHYSVLHVGKSRCTRGRVLWCSAICFGRDVVIENPDDMNLESEAERRLFFNQENVFDCANSLADWMSNYVSEPLTWWYSMEM